MEIYVANATLQHRQLSYRRREDMRPDAQPRTLEIPAAGQAKFPGEYDNEGVKWIITQLERSGGVPHDDLEAIKRPHTLVYRVQKVIESDTISEAVEADIDARTDIAADQMEKAGAAAFNAAQSVLRTNGKDPESLKEASLTIEEVTDVTTVEGGVNMEITASTKPGTPTKIARTERRPPRRRG
jgi:hypothetical protein